MSTTEQQTSEASLQYCAIKSLPPREFDTGVSPEREAAIMIRGDKWVNRTHLRYYMFNSGPFRGSPAAQDVVRAAFDVWKSTGMGLKFTEVEDISEAEIRIGFLLNDGSWSYVGTKALEIGQQERTMNFGWDITVAGPNGLDTAIHEIGHALGLKHEHQNPKAGITWDTNAVYTHFAQTQDPPWDHAQTDRNILNKIPPHLIEGSDWDPNSIMHYAFEANLIKSPAKYQNGLTPQPGLSAQDIYIIKHFYPEIIEDDDLVELKPLRSRLLSLEAGEQKDFRIKPKSTRTYTFNTFGGSDTVMVLFEEEANGDFRYMAGDDDSGLARNASFQVRLTKGKRYQLRVRLYYAYEDGNTAVMMW